MSTFDSTKTSLDSILRDIRTGKIQLPDFQRGWVWDDDHIRDLLVSIGRSFPVGAVMLLETGGDVKFQTRPVEGLETSVGNIEPEKLILDGQQRLTTLTQVLEIKKPVHTRTKKGEQIKRHYYFNIRQALDTPNELDLAVVAVDENRQIRSNFGRDIVLDLSSREEECLELYFPCDQVMNSDNWEETLHRVAPQYFPLYMEFRGKILKSFREYQIPVIQLHKETTKEAICLVFEKVNTGGVQLSVFELITASYAAEGYNLRDDWYGSTARHVESRQQKIAQEPLLEKIEATDFLQAIALLYTYHRKRMDISEGKIGKEIRPVSAKKADVLGLPVDAWERWADDLVEGFSLAARFLRKESFYSRRELPYSTQIIPLAAVLTHLGNRWLEPRIYDKLSRWFWCGILGELYGGAVETRIANDYEELLEWFEKDNAVPRTIFDASFQPDRLDTLRSRSSAAYKGISILVLRAGARDWLWKASIRDLDADDVALDIHHIFPQAWCKRSGIHRDSYDSILNKTSLSYRANRRIGGDAPSIYLTKIQNDKQVQINDADMDEILVSHAIDPSHLRTDNYAGFIGDRRRRLCELIASAMGKPVSPIAGNDSGGMNHAEAYTE